MKTFIKGSLIELRLLICAVIIIVPTIVIAVTQNISGELTALSLLFTVVLTAGLLFVTFIVAPSKSDERFLYLLIAMGSLIFNYYVIVGIAEYVPSKYIPLYIGLFFLTVFVLYMPVWGVNKNTNAIFPKNINKLLIKSKLPAYFCEDENFSQVEFDDPTDEELATLLNILYAEQALVEESFNYTEALEKAMVKGDKILTGMTKRKSIKKRERLSENTDLNNEIIELLEQK